MRYRAAGRPVAVRLEVKNYGLTPFSFSDSGVHGTRLSFTEQYPSFNPGLGGTTTMTQAVHQYILTNARQRAVMLQYVTVTENVSDEVRQMIEQTLRLEP